jgi:peptidylprolyl isomerase
MDAKLSRRRLLAAFSLLVTLMIGSTMSDTTADAAGLKLDPQNTVYMDIPEGRVVIQLRPELAPKHVARVKELCAEHFYDNTPFHRVIDGFMAQGGDPTGTGTGGSKLPNLPAEFSKTAHFLTGTVGAARAGDPNSANSQFFIMFAANPGLDGQYTIWGRVVEGMQFVNKIKRGTGPNGSVTDPDRILKMRLAAHEND